MGVLRDSFVEFALYTGQYNKENALPVPVFGKSTRELKAGTPKGTWGLCDFTLENKEAKPVRHLNPNCRPFFAVCIREVSSKKSKGFFGVYRYLAGADSEYWHGALKKIVLGWRLAYILFPPFPNPCTLVRS